MRKFWTLEEQIIVKKFYPHKLTSDLLFMLPGRTISGIAGQASKFGIHKSIEFMKSPLSGRITKDNDIGVLTRFKDNRPGWNKGKKQADYMTSEKIEKTKATRFKKGQDPHNTKNIGHERLSRDGYLEVKVKHEKVNGKNKNFVAKHRLIYENHFGVIPDNMNVEFIDGDKYNFNPSNFILRTKKENLINNAMCDKSIVKRFLGVKDAEMIEMVIDEMPRLIELKRNTIILNQKTKKHAKSS